MSAFSDGHSACMQAQEEARYYRHAAEMADAAARSCTSSFEQLTFVNSQVSGIERIFFTNN